MKFTVERIALQRMVEQLKIERGVKGQSQRMMRLSACMARVFVEANGVAAGIEALVLETSIEPLLLIASHALFHAVPPLIISSPA